MDKAITSKVKDATEIIYYRPAVCIIMPFEPKMTPKRTLNECLEGAADQVEHEILDHYPGEIGMLVVQKLRAMIKGLNYNTHTTSIAIYVSPLFEKLLYLDFSVEPKIAVAETFQLRDLLYNKRQQCKYLVVFTSGDQNRIYAGNASRLVKILSSKHPSPNTSLEKVPSTGANLQETEGRSQMGSRESLQYFDDLLDIILQSHPFPVFVFGPEQLIGQLQEFSRHAGAIVEYIHLDLEEPGLAQITDALRLLLMNWQKLKQKYILNQLTQAANKNNLAVGINNVWRDANNHHARLLVVERNYQGLAEQGSGEEIINKAINPYFTFSYIKNAVDDVIEKVLEGGGDVELVEDCLLEDFNHIALIRV